MINVLVAWAIALWAPYGLFEWPGGLINATGDVRSWDVDAWYGRVPADWPAQATGAYSFRASGITWQRRSAGRFRWIADSAGLPFRSLAADRLVGASADHRYAIYPVPGILQPRSTMRALPLRPVWLGFAANTAIYAMCVWAYLVIRSEGRYVMRRSRGLCVGCGYALAELTRCPECGRPRS